MKNQHAHMFNLDQLLYRFKNGIQLIHPDNLPSQKIRDHQPTPYTLKDILTLPLNIGFLNYDAVIQFVNTESALNLGFDSAHEAVGKTIQHLVTRESARYVLQCTQAVMNSSYAMLTEETITRQDDLQIHRLQMRMPWYNSHGKIIGLFGCNTILGKQSLAHSLLHMTSLGLFNTPHQQILPNQSLPGLTIGSVYLTQREVEILKLLIRGMISKTIAKKLKISPRTVEQHLVNIKTKLQVYSKAALIEKVIDYIGY